MSCETVRGALVEFHFGVVSDATRQQVQAHLLTCRPCLDAYFEVKTEVETAGSVERPSDVARVRLRKAVVRELKGEPETRPFAWWERPVAFGVASAAVVASVFVLQALTSGAGSLPHAMGDSGAAWKAGEPGAR